MRLSDLSVRRPVLAAVMNLLVIAFGILSFTKLPLREYPDIDPPIVSIQTTYPGAAASVMETRITQIIEDRIAGIEGVKSITSQSRDGDSRITIEFEIDRDIDDATNDIRDRVSSSLDDLPQEADPPDIQKANADDEVIIWLNLQATGMSIMDITDYARRNIEDRFSAIDGVARVRIGGAQERAMRIWLDRNKLAARSLSPADVVDALRAENVELPAGSLESAKRDFTMRVERSYRTPEDFAKLVLSQGEGGYLVRLSDVARVEIGAVEKRTVLRGNGVPMVGVGIIKQSKANTVDVARRVRTEMEEVNESLPAHMALASSYDTSIFIESAIHEVYVTLAITIALVVLVIYLFLGNWRATLVPAVAVPVSLIGTFILLYMAGFTINLLTLLGLVLAIGLVVDDAIVVIENIYRRMQHGESRMVASYRGTMQVAFAVIATTLVLVAVFVPITFLEGDIGRLFTEFAITMAAAVLLSAFVALTFSPMLSSQILKPTHTSNKLTQRIDEKFEHLKTHYLKWLASAIAHPYRVVAILVGVSVVAILIGRQLPSEFVPLEDRGAFFITIRGPEGTSYNYIKEHMDEVERRLMPYVKSGEINRLLMRAPGSFGSVSSFNDAAGTVVLSGWDERKPQSYYLEKVKELTRDIAGVRIFAVARPAFGGPQAKPVEFVLGGPTFEELVQWRDIVLAEAANNPGLVGLDHDYFETKPQIGITVRRDAAGALGVSVDAINSTLETLMGSRRVTTFIDRGEEYDVMVESEKSLKRSPLDVANTYVRSERTGKLIPLSNLVSIREFADAGSLNRYNRVRAITISSSLAPGYSLSEALLSLEDIVRTKLPASATIDYKNESQDLKAAGSSIYLVFVLALVIVFLVLAGQFESFVHPIIIMLTVPLAMAGAVAALWLTGQTLNIYSQIGLIILIGLSAKNGILIVEFVNQLRDEGVAFNDAIIQASSKRLRPIIMTSLTTIMGAVPLVLASGAGAETRLVIGIVIVSGLALSTILTLFVVPVLYALLARGTTSPESTSRQLEAELVQQPDQEANR